MPVPELPDFEQTLQLPGLLLDAAELSEVHGVLCGLLCRQPGSRADSFMRLLATLGLMQNPDPGVGMRMTELYEATAAQLADDQLRLALWLPGDEELLEERTLALGQWCTGFLAGLGHGNKLSDEVLSEDVSEALTDLAQIAQAELSGEEDSEDEESALAEIIEYVRVVTIMMREELSPPQPHESLH